MSDKDFTAIQSSEDIVASCYVGEEETNVGLDKAVQVKPYEGLSYDDSYQTIEKFLREEYLGEDQTGFEIVYDHADRVTKFNLLRDESEDNKSLDNFSNADIAEVGTEEANPFNNLTEGSYVAGGEIHFTKDYWHSLLTGEDFDKDPLQSLITEISQNGGSEVTTVIQLTATRVEDSRVRKRYPILHRLRNPVKTLLYTPYKVLQALWDVAVNDSKEDAKGDLEELYPAYVNASRDLTGYTRKNFLVELNQEKESITEDSVDSNKQIEGVESKDPKSTQSELEKAMDRVRDKSNSELFGVQMRLLVIGEDKQRVEKRAKNVNRDLKALQSTSEDDASVQQRLVTEPAGSRNQLKQLIMDVGQRKTATNIQNKFRDKHGRVRSLHKKRRKPMIMSKEEIAAIMHMPSDEVTDRSITYGKESVSGRVPDY